MPKSILIVMTLLAIGILIALVAKMSSRDQVSAEEVVLVPTPETPALKSSPLQAQPKPAPPPASERANIALSRSDATADPTALIEEIGNAQNDREKEHALKRFLKNVPSMSPEQQNKALERLEKLINKAPRGEETEE